MLSDMIDIRWCPECGTDWRGKPIPEKDRHLYSKGATHYSRLIGIEISEKYDGVSYWDKRTKIISKIQNKGGDTK